ncbi:histidine ammonia-lyase [Zooshikella ganghwensis]|uniref:histidine ammonia-lyase n=1 Tax=Zooshikella ganghwensis TaxID=202772 RepID=UPI00048206AB|nr:histidine ammonia-lyase [Zooshikella ganghwensis]
MDHMKLQPGQLTLAQLRQVWQSPCQVSLDDQAWSAVSASADVIAQVLAQGRTVYGVNTGFGVLASTRIADDELEKLQHCLVLSHAAGIGDPLDEPVVRLMLLLKINSLARGFSGVRPEVIQALCQLLNTGVYPLIPAQGSVGASGDLAPLAHMAATLIGEGEAFYNGERMPAKVALTQINMEPLTLAPKEGLALLNGTQASTALALAGLFATEDVFAAGMVTGATCVDATLGSRKPFMAEIHQVRGHQAQIDVALMFRDLLDKSQIEASHVNCDRVQDPYSLRCQPQVMGACLQQMRHAAEIIITEANAVSDNPLVFADDIVSGGNFHAEPIAMAADNLALAIAEVGALSERRIALLVDKHMSQLPPFLVANSGVNSGFMIAQVTAAALASENKSLAHPSSVDSLPTSANQEDHVSMATYAARRLKTMAANTAGIIAIEWLGVVQGLDFRKPLLTSEPLQQAYNILREKVKFYEEDRYFSPDIEIASQLIQQGVLYPLITQPLLPSQANKCV